MCLAVYIASDHALPIVAFDRARLTFHVEEAVFCPDNPVRRHVSKPFIYYAGSCGCGCGFEFDGFYNDEGEYEARDLPEQVASRRGLADFLSAALQHQAEVEVFTCWSGDESIPPEHRRRARPVDFIQDRTLFRLRELVLVSEQNTEPDAAADGDRS